MYTIDVDFDVYKQLNARRATEDITYNEVIRELLGMAQLLAAQHADNGADQTQRDWVVRGVRFPGGTDFRARHNGQMHTARVVNGALMLNGKRYISPSAAATSITGRAVDGWYFWECMLPGKSSWQLIDDLR
jgi:hypothetical protein